jgi:hypothetical protein
MQVEIHRGDAETQRKLEELEFARLPNIGAVGVRLAAMQKFVSLSFSPRLCVSAVNPK